MGGEAIKAFIYRGDDHGNHLSFQFRQAAVRQHDIIVERGERI